MKSISPQQAIQLWEAVQTGTVYQTPYGNRTAFEIEICVLQELDEFPSCTTLIEQHKLAECEQACDILNEWFAALLVYRDSLREQAKKAVQPPKPGKKGKKSDEGEYAF